MKSRHYFSNFVNFEIDGAFAGRLLAATGGEPFIALGSYNSGTRTWNSMPQYVPLSLNFGDMAAAVFDWVGKASANLAGGRDAAVVTSDATGRELYRLAMQGARLTQVAFDALDANRGESLRVSATIQPTKSRHELSAKTVYKGETFKPSPLLRSNFRLLIQGLETATTRARTVDPIGLQAGSDGVLAPMPLRFTLALPFAAPLFGWMNDTLVGRAGPRPGELQFLSRDLNKVAASVAFENLQILRISCPVDARGEQTVQEAEVECLPAATRFNMGELLGA